MACPDCCCWDTNQPAPARVYTFVPKLVDPMSRPESPDALGFGSSKFAVGMPEGVFSVSILNDASLCCSLSMATERDDVLCLRPSKQVPESRAPGTCWRECRSDRESAIAVQDRPCGVELAACGVHPH